MTELSDAVKFWQEYTDEIERYVEIREDYARPLERAAHLLLKDEHRYTRAGSYPCYTGTLANGKLHFRVSNGRDPSDDFTCAFFLEELEG